VLIVIVVVQTSSHLARELKSEPSPSVQARAVHAIVAGHGLRLEPLHPDTTDPELGSKFFVDTPDQQTAERLRRQIEQLGIVDAVYVKPTEAPP
jgi:hypothetical protein